MIVKEEKEAWDTSMRRIRQKEAAEPRVLGLPQSERLAGVCAGLRDCLVTCAPWWQHEMQAVGGNFSHLP